MYDPIENGTVLNVQGLNCNIPPEGYVYNIVTKQLEYIGIHSRSDNPKEQYWERTPLPSWYKVTIKRESEYENKRKEDDPPFYDEVYENYKKKEWDRRLNGFWFMNNGNPTYMTGSHYLFLQWWMIDIGYGRFRIPDAEYFYFLQYCIEDPNCMGMLEITKRRFGKTFRGGLFLTEYVTRTKMTNAGIQSKTGMDSKKVFGKAVVSPFKKLPRFFRPEYDMSLGITPKTEMRFQQTNIRGKKAEEGLDKDELGSLIDHQSADIVAYDGQKLHRYFGDEWAKTVEVNVYDRHEVIRYCLLDDEGNIIGKALYSSTVEKVETDRDGVQVAAKLLWDESDHTNRMDNGRTPSGLYRFFMTADRARNFDIYGFPNVEKTIKEILEDRESVKHNPRALSARMHKEARTVEEAFSDAGDKCVFNITNINEREIHLKDNPIYKREVLFYMDEKQNVKWREIQKHEKDFCWRLTQFPPAGQENKRVYDGKMSMPGRTRDGAISVDSYSNSQGGRKYGSKASAWIGRKLDITDPDNTLKAIGHLYGRPQVKETLHEQVMLASIYFGYATYYEHTSDDYLSFFRERGKAGYLGKYPLSLIDHTKRDTQERYKGTPITPFSLTKQLDNGIAYVENYPEKLDFEEFFPEAKKFDPYNRTESDMVVSWLILISVLTEPIFIPQAPKTPLVRIFPNMGIQNN
tara:strand:- start:752 stop:2815 length:2064 start_codon:yes stop_codon:yes gene_type:complete